MDDFLGGAAGEQPGVATEDFGSFEAPPAETEAAYEPPQNGIPEDAGAKLPPPSQMGHEESILLRYLHDPILIDSDRFIGFRILVMFPVSYYG